MKEFHGLLRRLFITHKYEILILSVCLLAVALRVYNFQTRWGIGDDDARDISIAMEALRRGELPLIGSFSSAGPFVFGPLFYWTIMFSYIIFPGVLFAPWIITVLSSCAVVVLLMLIARRVGDRTLVVLVGFLAATSPQLVLRAFGLGQHSFIALLSTLLLYFYVLFWQTANLRYAFLTGLSIGIALSFHYQALNLLLFFPALLLIPSLVFAKRLHAFCLALVGFSIPSFPLFFWDFNQGFSNTRNILDYFLIAQHRLYVPNSWKIFVTSFLPDFWSFITGGSAYLGYFFIITTVMFIFYLFVTKRYHVLSVLGVMLLFLLFVTRYYKGERSEGYLIYFVPFILLFTSLVLQKIYQVNRYVAIALLFLILFGSVTRSASFFRYDNGLKNYEPVVTQITKKYPSQKVSLFDYMHKTPGKSQPLSVALNQHGLTSQTGIPIGVTCVGVSCPTQYSVIAKGKGFQVVELENIPDLSDKRKWVNVNSESMYDDLIGWSKTYSLTSSFSLQSYLTERLRL